MNIYGVRLANQMGWSKVIKEAEQDGGVVITSNGKSVALVVSLSDVNIDGDELKEAFSHPFMGRIYSSMIPVVVAKVIKEMIVEVKTDLVMKNDNKKDRRRYVIDWFKKVMKKKVDDMYDIRKHNKLGVSINLENVGLGVVEDKDYKFEKSKYSQVGISINLGDVSVNLEDDVLEDDVI